MTHQPTDTPTHPPTEYPNTKHTQAPDGALSFGVGGAGTGVSWHVHGPGYSEVGREIGIWRMDGWV